MENNFEQKLTKLEQENKKLKKELQYYSGLLENHNDAVVIHDFNGEIIAWDRVAESIFGWKQNELLGTSIFKIIPEKFKKNYQQFIIQIQENTAERYIESQKITSDGKIKDIWMSYKVLGGEEPYAIATSERDITERKKVAEKIRHSEEKYEMLVNSLGDGIILLDKEYNIILTNPATEHIFFAEKNNLINSNIKELLTPRNYDILRNNLEANQKSNHIFEIEYIRNDGEPRIFQITISKSDKHKKNDGSKLCIIRDITDLRNMEEELIKADKLESLGLLAGGIAHDFNNILSIINGNVTLAQMCMDDKTKLQERLDRIMTANERAKQLTHQISTLSKGHSVSKMQVSIEKLVKECVSLTLDSKKITHKLEMQENLPTIRIDEGQISQVLNNLLINATHAIDIKTGEIIVFVNEVTMEEQNALKLSPGNYIRIVVKDNGCGISEENIKKIFDPYFTTKDFGTGLGLSTSISIINKHGGKLKVTSKLDIGTTFFIYLPINDNDRTAREERHFTTNGKVLLMDDEESIRAIGELFFQKLNYKIVLASEGQEALDLYRSQLEKNDPFDFVFLDLNIPNGMNGKTCAKEIIKLDPNAKLIAISGNVNLSDYQDYGFIKALKKPFRIAGIKSVIKEIS
jgi:two-component system cell cycle sensor histidine kinase/response regulator CckA